MKLLKPLATSLMLGSALTMSVVANAKSTIDVLVVYTDEMLQEAADPDARIALMGKWMNDAFKGSHVDADIRIVHTQKVNFANDSKTDGAALNALTSNDEVAELRKQHGADMVAMITKTGPYCGIAWVPGSRSQGKLFGKNSSYSVTGANCVSAFAHELGHNMGLGHSAAQGSEGSLHSWGRGHGINNTFVTTMAYASAYNAPVTAQRFSNPAISTCTNNLPCGIPRDQSNGADAARSLNQVVSEVEAYFPTNNDGGGDGGGDDSDTEAPTKPGTLSSSNVQQNSATLNWIASTDNVGVDHYEVFRDNNRVATATQTSYADGGLTAGTTYRYHVIAKDKAGNSSPASNFLNVTTEQAPPPADTTAPTAPSGLNVTGTTTSSISISWQAATDNVGVTGYQIMRNGTQIATSAATSYTDSDNNLTQGVSYYYEVKAVDAADNVSAVSNRVAGELKQPDTNKPGAGSDVDNILENGHFNSFEGWNAAAAAITQSDTATGGSKSLLVTDRYAYYSGAYQFIAPNKLEKGASYTFQADIRLAKSAGSAPVAVILNYPTANGRKTHTLSTSKVSNTGWSRVTSNFDVSSAATGYGYIYAYGPDKRFDMLVDEVLIKKVKSSTPPTTVNENLVSNPDFEKSVDGWEAFYGGSLMRDTDAFKGQGAAKLSNRSVFYSGIAQDMSKTLKAGKTYNFSATLKHTGSEEPQYLDMYLYYKAEGEYRGRWLEISSKSSTNSNTWTELQGSFTTSGKPVAEAYLMMFGPDANLDLHLDEVMVKEAK